jgi:hypothetical protein
MLQIGDKAGERLFEIDAVFPQRIVGIDDQVQSLHFSA